METPIQAKSAPLKNQRVYPGDARTGNAPASAMPEEDSLALWNAPLQQLAQETAQVNHLLQQAAVTLRANATNPHYYYEIGMRLKQQGRLEPAAQHFRRTLQLAPAHMGAWVGLVEILIAQRDWSSAQAAVGEALGYHDTSPRLHFLAARCCAQQSRWAEAASHLRAALALDSQEWSLWLLLADALRRQGLMDEALQALEQVCRLHPFDAQAQWGQAMLHLQQQAWTSGWSRWSWRPERIKRAHQQAPPWSYWQGEPLQGKVLLVRCEPGLSWNLLFASCLPSLCGKADTLLLEAPAGMDALWRRSFPWAEVIPAGAFTPEGNQPGDFPQPHFECHLGDLPRHLRGSLEAFPRQNVYLQADPVQVERFRRMFAAKGRMCAGLLWRPLSRRQDRFGRALSLEACKPLLQRDEVSWIPLLRPDPYEARLWQQLTGQQPMLLPPEVYKHSEVEQTAALLAALDLVIGVPTYHMHLAGGLGLNGWVLLSQWPSWMWPIRGETTPWYPSLRLFRQGTDGRWDPAVCQMAQSLHELFSPTCG